LTSSRQHDPSKMFRDRALRRKIESKKT